MENETCTECKIGDAVVPLKDGRRMCNPCLEDWLEEEWENANCCEGYGQGC